MSGNAMDRDFEAGRLANLPEPSIVRGMLRRIKRHLVGEEIKPWPIAPYRTVELTYWRPPEGVNFGDELGRTVVELMLARRGMTIEDEIKTPRQLLSVGSIIHFARTDAVIWGSGINGAQAEWAHRFKALDVRAVRGPHTRRYLQSRGISVPEIYGDPALLLPKLTEGRFKRTSEARVAFVPNLHDHILVKSKIGLPIIDPMRSWNSVVPDILKYDFVLASSLHGLIVAEAYGIPARYIRLTSKEGIWKYADYYEGTGRRCAFAGSIEEGLAMGPMPLPTWDASALEGSFPYDVWQ